MEDMPEAFINLGDEVLRATPENSRLITFLGREALNCILIGGEDYTMIMFDTSEHYDELGSFMVENEYPLHLNQQEVPDEIMDYYVSLEAEDIPDTIPDWMS